MLLLFYEVVTVPNVGNLPTQLLHRKQSAHASKLNKCANAHAWVPLPQPVMAACTDFGLEVGDTFASFANLERDIREIENRTSVQLWRREIKTLESQNEKVSRWLCKFYKSRH